MPYAKIDVGFIREHFRAVPDKDRAELVGLYTALVLHSAEMLADGLISDPVLHAIADTIGLEQSRKAGRKRDTSVSNLVGCGLLAEDSSASWRIVFWRDHHSSRHDVEEARTRATERKRRSRGQLQLDDVTLTSQRDKPVTSQRDIGVTRAHTHAQGTAAEKELRALDVNEEDQHDPNLNGLMPAAAGPHDEAPRESRIRQIVDALPGHDAGSFNRIYPLAAQLPAQTFDEIAQLVTQRRNVRNPTGLLVTFLQAAAETARQPAFIPGAQTPADAITDYATSLAGYPWEVAADLIQIRITRLTDDDDQRLELADIAADAHRERAVPVSPSGNLRATP